MIVLHLVLLSMAVVLLFLGALGIWYLQTRLKDRKLERYLSSLDPHSFRVIRNVTLPSAKGKLTVSHVIVSAFGIFVINKKVIGRVLGSIKGNESHRTWADVHRKVGGGHWTRFPVFRPLGAWRRQGMDYFPNPILENRSFVESLRKLLGQSYANTPCYPVVVIVASPVKGVRIERDDSSNEEIMAPGYLPRFIRRISETRKQCLWRNDLDMISERILTTSLLQRPDESPDLAGNVTGAGRPAPN